MAQQFMQSVDFGGPSREFAREYLRDAQQAVIDREREALKNFEKFPTYEEMSTIKYGDTNIDKGYEYNDLFNCITAPYMRIGFILQLVSLVSLFVIYYGHGGQGVFSFDLSNISENIRHNTSFMHSMISFLCVYIVGCLLLLVFQAFVMDNSKVSRGFRAGSKLLNIALILDLIVSCLRYVHVIHSQHFLSTKWWFKYAQEPADFSLFSASILLQAYALQLYGIAILFMEGYHDQGTVETFAWINFTLYTLASWSQGCLFFCGFGQFYIVFHILAVLFTVIWSLSFEPTVHYYSQELHDRNANEGLNIFPAAAAPTASQMPEMEGYTYMQN